MKKIMINIAFLLTLFMSCLQESSIKYLNDQYEVSYPETWNKQQKGIATFFLSPKINENDIFQENVNIMIQDLSAQPLTLEEYTKLTIDQITQALGSSAIESNKALDFSGEKAREIVYSMPGNNNLNLKLRQIWLVRNNKAFLITYTAQDSEYVNYIGVVDDIFNSFRLKK